MHVEFSHSFCQWSTTSILVDILIISCLYCCASLPAHTPICPSCLFLIHSSHSCKNGFYANENQITWLSGLQPLMASHCTGSDVPASPAGLRAVWSSLCLPLWLQLVPLAPCLLYSNHTAILLLFQHSLPPLSFVLALTQNLWELSPFHQWDLSINVLPQKGLSNHPIHGSPPLAFSGPLFISLL